MTQKYTLYGMAGSLYTAKVRAYMRRNQIPFEEVKSGSERFMTVVRKAVGRWIIPVIETPEGEFVQDGSNILDYFEAHGYSRQSIFPEDPRLKVIAHLFELFGGEGLLRPAMHYRWNFDETNLAFIKSTFRDLLPDDAPPEAADSGFEDARKRMKFAAAFFGVTPEVHKTIEASYDEFLALFDAHLSDRPYLLGGYPTAGDYGLFNPLYAHLGRDPKPLHLMQLTAPRVFRWTERMNTAETFVDEPVAKAGNKLVKFAGLPDTLKALMRYIGEEYLPEIAAHVDFANRWLEHNPNPAETHNPRDRSIGMATFSWRGHKISTAVMPYRFYLLQRLQDTYNHLDGEQQSEVRDLFAETGLESLIDLHTSRRVARENHLEVWR